MGLMESRLRQRSQGHPDEPKPGLSAYVLQIVMERGPRRAGQLGAAINRLELVVM